MSSVNIIKLSVEQLEGTEATFSTWLVSTGDHVIEGQPIAELETDKVAIEICAEHSGTIQFLAAKQGDKVEPEQALGKIIIGEQAIVRGESNDQEITKSEFSLEDNKTNHLQDELYAQNTEQNQAAKKQLSPAVRRLIKENDIDVKSIHGSGKQGRVTRDDINNHLKNPPLLNQSRTNSLFDDSLPIARSLKGKMIPHSNMRKSIASHMAASLLEISPHVTSVFEVDMGNVIEHRKWHKKEYLEHAVKLTFTAYFLSAMVKAVAKVPQVNARFHQDALEIFSDINIGVGTALGGSGLKDSGLVVPVVQQVQNMNLFQIAKSLSLQTEKARTSQLKPSDMKNGTLTISNHGVSGSLFATPIIINQPEVAILGIGKLEKRVVVEQIDGVDEMVIRPKCYVSLSIDHRALDAHQTNMFLSEFVEVIESWGN